MAFDERLFWYNVIRTRGLGPEKARKIARFLSFGRSYNEILHSDAGVIGKNIGLPISIANSLKENLDAPIDLPFCGEGVELLLPCDGAFPIERFLNAIPHIPALLWAGGSSSLLHAPKTAAVVGSRNASPQVLESVQEFSHALSRRQIVVVSGLAKGVDSSAHRGAISGGAGTVGVLASGIANSGKAWQPDDFENMCVISEFSPSDPWSGPRAMQRNQTIAGLSDIVIIAAAGRNGGSWEMAELCMKKSKRLFVFDIDTEFASGNRLLINRGAIPLEVTNSFEVALDQIEEIAWQPGQAGLF